MIEKISRRVTDRLLQMEIIEESQCERVDYGMQYMISLAISILILVAIAVLSGGYVEVVGFIIGFSLLRSSGGGYHAGSYLMCQILSVIIITLNLMILQHGDVSVLAVLLITLLNIMTVFMLSPVAHENRPFTDEEFNKFRMMSRLKVLLVSFISLAGILLFDGLKVFFISATFGVFTSALSIFIAYASVERRHVHNDV